MSEGEGERQPASMTARYAWTGLVLACISAVAITAGMIAGGRWQNPFGPPDPLGAIAACEVALKAELKAPSSYRRISAEAYTLSPLTREEFTAYHLSGGCTTPDNPASCQNLIQLGSAYAARDPDLRAQLGLKGALPRTREKAEKIVADVMFADLSIRPKDEQRTGAAKIVYEAVNSYNAPLRDAKYCRFGPIRTKARYEVGDLFDPAAHYIYYEG